MTRSRLPRPARVALLAIAAGVSTAPSLFAQGGATLTEPSAKSAAELPPFEVAAIDKPATSWFGRFGFSNCAWMELGDAVLVVDSGATKADAQNLAAEIKRTTHGKPIKWFVLTHLHSDSNGGLAAIVPSDAIVFVHARVAAGVSAGLGKDPRTAKGLTVVGVTDRNFVTAGGKTVEIGAVGSAHTDHDLYAYALHTGTIFSGDLVATQRCPMTSDPATDPKGWIAALERLETYRAGLLVPTRGDGTRAPEAAIAATKDYLKRLHELLVRYRAEKYEESRVSSSLTLEKFAVDCPRDLNAANALSLYRRLQSDGTYSVAAPPKPAASRPAAKSNR